MNFKEIPRVLFNAAYSSEPSFLCSPVPVFWAGPFAMMQVPQQVLNLFTGLKPYPWLILLIMNVFLLWMGCGSM